MKRSGEKAPSYAHEAFRLVKEALHPNAAIRGADGDGVDAVIELEGGQEIPVEFMLWGDVGHRHEPEPRQVWVLPGTTSGLRDRFRAERQSFVDLRGTVFLTFPNLLVDRADVRPPPRPATVPRSFDPFADRSSLVVRTLLKGKNHPPRSWGVRELAEAAGVGPATVTRTVRGLERYRVVDVRRAGRNSEIRLTDAQALFTLWTGVYDWSKNPAVAVHAPVGDPVRFLRRLASTLGSLQWALTLHAGASLVAPHATWERIHAYVDVETPEALIGTADELGWPAAQDGRLVLMKPYYRDSVWHAARKVEGLPVVSDLQLALDLWRYPLRGREQAEHVIATRHLLG